MTRVLLRTSVCVGLVLVTGLAAARAASWNVVTDFGSTNPSAGVWSFGSMSADLVFMPYDEYVDLNGVIGSPAGQLMEWRRAGNQDPNVIRNFGDSLYVFEFDIGAGNLKHLYFPTDALNLNTGWLWLSETEGTSSLRSSGSPRPRMGRI